MTLVIVKPTVGGDTGAWGGELNTALDAIVTQINANTAAITAGAAQLVPDETLHSSSFTAVANNIHSVSLGANVTATLPVNPPDKTQIYFYVSAFTPGFSLTVAHGTGDTFFNGSSTLTRSIGVGQFVWLQFDTATRQWRELGAGMPLALSDARYVQASSLAAVATSGAGSDLTGTMTLAQTAPGMLFAVSWNGSAWVFNGSTITVRPTGRTDLTMLAYGNTTAPSFAIVGDLWLQDTA